MHVAKLVRIESKPFVSVLGDGVMGLLVAQVLARRNASVRLLGKLPARFALCEKWGIKHRAVGEVGMHQDQDVVIDCTGRASGTELALRLARPRGMVIVKGWPCPARSVHETGQRLNLSYLLAGELTLVGSGSGAGAGGFAEAIRVIEEGTVDVHSLMTHRFGLSQAGRAIEEAAQPNAIKVLLDPSRQA
jgi:L-iditol 2-dehydrogenase